MTSIPQRRHTKLGRYNALLAVGAIQTLCQKTGQYDPDCGCPACDRCTASDLRRLSMSVQPMRGFE